MGMIAITLPRESQFDLRFSLRVDGQTQQAALQGLRHIGERTGDEAEQQ